MPTSLTITPAVALIDVPRQIESTGFTPNTIVELTLTSRLADGRVWRSQNW